jgi:hypothetical protein
MDCLEVETGVDDLVAAFVEKSTQALRPALIDSTRMIGWLRPILCCAPSSASSSMPWISSLIMSTRGNASASIESSGL